MFVKYYLLLIRIDKAQARIKAPIGLERKLFSGLTILIKAFRIFPAFFEETFEAEDNTSRTS